MGYYSSCISVNNFFLFVKANNKEDARNKIMDRLHDIHVYITEEGHGDEELDCMIMNIDEEHY